MPQNIGDNRILDIGIARVTKEDAQRLSKYRIREGDIVYSRRGDVERCALVRETEDGWLCGTGCLRIRFGDGVVYPRYAAHYLGHPAVRKWIVRHAHGATMPNLNTTILSELPFVLPAWSDQVSIGDSIEAYDRKIDLNRRINQTLEAMAQAIFKSWFVDFDPVKAKVAAIQEGRDPLRAAMSAISGKPAAELDVLPLGQYAQLAATAALFQDEMEESEFGEIPKGWAGCRIGEVTSRIAMGPFGSDIKKENFVEAGVPVIRGGNLTDGLVEHGYVFLSENKADELKNANAFPGDIVITHRGTLGQVGLIPKRSRFPRYVVSQSQMLLSVDSSRMSSRYLFEFLRSEDGRQQLLSYTSQVGVPAIARPTSSVKALQLIVPRKDVLDAYDSLLEPLLNELTHLTKSSETLAELRDALLPKLLSGELSVSQINTEARV